MKRGPVLGLVYVGLTASSIVFLNHAGGGIPIAAALFYMALGASVVFGLTEFKRLRQNHAGIVRHTGIWVAMSVAFVVNWLFSYYSATHAPPEFFIAVFFVVAALWSCVVSLNYLKVIACLTTLAAVYVLTPSATPKVLLTSCGAGTATYLYYVTSQRYTRAAGLGPIAVVSTRCYLLCLCCAVYLVAAGKTSELRIETDQIGSLVFLVTVNMVIPSFLSQTCLHMLGVRAFTFMNSFIPVLTFFLQAALLEHWQPGMLVASGLATCALNFELIARRASAASAARGSHRDVQSLKPAKSRRQGA